MDFDGNNNTVFDGVGDDHGSHVAGTIGAKGGNDGTNNDSMAHYPANYPNANVIAVASITSTGGLTSLSNYGTTAAQIKAAILGSVSPTASLAGRCVTGGRLNVSGF